MAERTGHLFDFKAKFTAAALLCAALALLCSCSANKVKPQEPVKPADVLPPAALSAMPARQSAQERLRAAISYKDAGRLDDAVSVLRELRLSEAGTVWSSRASFLLGVYLDGTQERGGVLPARGYLEEASSMEGLREYSLYYLAGSWRKDKDFRKAARYYDTLIKDYPDSALLPRALFEKAAVLDESGDSTAARAVLKDFTRLYPRHKLTPDVLLRIAQYSIRAGDRESAVAPLRNILTDYPDQAAANAAQITLQKMRSDGVIVPSYTAEERGHRAQRLFDAAHYNDALTEFTYIAKHGGPEQRADASLMNILTLTRLKNYEKAQKAARDYLSSKKTQGYRKEPEALYLLALASMRLGDAGTLATTEKRLAENYPQRKETAEVIYLAGRAYEDAGEMEKAVSEYRRAASEYGGTAASMNSYWRVYWMEYTSGRYEDALNDLSACLGSGGDRKNADQLTYWYGRTLEKLGRTAEASEAYTRTCRELPFSYYCQIAGERASSLGPENAAKITDDAANSGADDGTEATSPEATDDAAATAASADGTDGSADARALLAADRHYRAALELTSLGLADAAAPELELLYDKYKDDMAALTELAGLYYDSGDYYRALRSFKRFYAVSGASHLPPAMLKAAWPPMVLDKIKKASASGFVDPYLVASIMREESAFNPRAVSWAGAMGLMQIMPKTAELIARELGADYSGSRELFTPELNTRFGAWYLGYLSKKFGSDLVLTIAGYNAGPVAASKWVCPKPMDADEFIETIPYLETRNYVKRVLNSYARFTRLNGQAPPPLLIKKDGAQKPPATADASAPPQAPAAVASQPEPGPGKN